MAARIHSSLTLFIGALISGLATAEDLFFDSSNLPEVLTATRLRQPPAEVPGSVSVIDRELIRASGARELTELLRLVPGMLVTSDRNRITINYHGSSPDQARRLQVLVDGRSVYSPGFARVDWSDIPLALEDIERIEVFRGPNTVSYGANALLGVVNIITRAPSYSHGARLKVTHGQRGIDDWYASLGEGWADGDLRLSLSGRQDDGFDHDEQGRDVRDSRRLNRLNLRVAQTLDERQSLDWQLALKEGSNQMSGGYEPEFPITPELSEQEIAMDIKARDYAGSLRWELDLNPEHRLQVQTSLQHWERLSDWRACEAQLAVSPALGALWKSSPDYLGALVENISSGDFTPPPGTAFQQAQAQDVIQQFFDTYDPASGTLAHFCGLVDEDLRETRFDIEVQDTLSLSDSLRLVSGLSYRHESADSESYFGGHLSKELIRTFGQLEWHLDHHWLLQGGAMFEHDSLEGDSLSPRLSLHYLITPTHGLRAVYSEAVRSPDLFENHADWQYLVHDITPTALGQSTGLFFVSAQAPGHLDQERIRSHELGYNGHFTRLGLHLDVKVFDEELTQLISDQLVLSDFNPSNEHRLHFQGVEGEADWQLGRQDRLRLSYAYIEHKATHRDDARLTPRHSGTVGWMRDWGRGWSSAAFYQGADLINSYRFERLDLRLAKHVQIGDRQLELAGVMQQRLDDEPFTRSDKNYDERRVFWLSADLAL